MQQKLIRGIRAGLRWVPALFAFLFLAGCFGEGKQSTIRPESGIGRVIQSIYSLVTWIDIGIFLVVAGLLLFAIIRYRARPGDEDKLPEQVHGNALMEVIWTVIPAAILVFIAVPTWSGIFQQADIPKGDVLKVDAIGHQWWWEFKYPGLELTTANELYVPVGKPVAVTTFSKDVIHSFWVPRLAGKIDTMPGRTNHLWFTPDVTGTYFGQCAEFCGTSHANMRFRVHVVTQEEFDAWKAAVQQPPAPRNSDAEAGKQLFATKTCVACHTIEGNPIAAGVLGPNLTNLPARETIAAGIIDRTPENLVRWIRDPQAVKPGAKMGLKQPDGSYKPIPVTEQEARQLAAYLLSPPAAPGEAAGAGQQQAAMTSAGGQQAQPAAPGGKSAEQIIRERGCGACHKIPGVPEAQGTLGPDLAGLMKRPTIAAGKLKTTPENIRKWLHDPKAVKPDTLMPNLHLSDQELNTLVDFLTQLK